MTRTIILTAVVFCSCFSVVGAQPFELISNGDFNQGGLGWQVAGSGNGGWFIRTVGTPAPLSGLPTSADGEASGLMALTDQTGPAIHVLLQTFTVPEDMTSVIISFDMFANDWSSQSTFNPDQHARVDILTGNAGAGDVGAGVVHNLYIGADGGPLPNKFTHYEFEIAPFVETGGNFQLRFYEIDNFAQLTVAVDNVSITAVPEPSSIILIIAGCLFSLALLKIRKKPSAVSSESTRYRMKSQ